MLIDYSTERSIISGAAETTYSSLIGRAAVYCIISVYFIGAADLNIANLSILREYLRYLSVLLVYSLMPSATS